MQLAGVTEVLEDRTLLSTFYVDNAGDFTITNDQGAGGLDAGDTVTWNPSGNNHPDGAVAGLIFGSEAFASIQDAVNAAAANGAGLDDINVAAGTYLEHVSIATAVNLRGANVGTNPVSAVRNAESIVDGQLTGAPFAIAANGVTIDGFQITGGQNGLNAGISTSAAFGGYSITNNVINNNTIGVYANSNSAASITNNLFDSNNIPGPSGGAGIYSDQGTLNLTISGNRFINHTENNPVIFAATPATSHVGVQFTNNDLDNDFGVFGLKIINGTFQGNRIQTNNSTALTIADGSSNVDVLNNDLSGNARGLRVIDFGFFGAVGLNAVTGVEARFNDLSGNTDAGLLVVAGGHTGIVNASANYWGTSDPAAVAGMIDAADNNVDFSPLLDNGDADLLTLGFQANLSSVTVHTQGAQTTGLIQEGINLVNTGGTVNVAPGNYTENVTINKNLSLLSTGGRAVTTITGISGAGALGTVRVTNNTSDVTLGDTGQGFTIIGIDNGMPNIENAAVYFQGAHTGATVRGNEIVANGDHGLANEFNVPISGFVIDNNIFSGQTFVGPNPAGTGSTNQFSLPNVPRQLVLLGNGGGNAATATATDITFTNNQIIGIAGGISLTDPNGNPAPAHEQGNSLVTLDVANSIITGNTFSGTTTSFHSALRVRRPDTVIAGNTFDSTDMGLGTTHLLVENSTTPIQTIVALNDFDKGSYVDNGTTVSVSITGGIGRAIAGDTLNVLAGTYAESVNVNKKITLDGAGSGNSATDTIIDATGLASGLAVTASGTSAVDRVEVRDLRVSGATSSNVLLNSVSHVTLDNVAAVNSASRGIEIAGNLSDLIFENVNASNNVSGLRMGTLGSLDGLVIDDSAFNNNSLQGIVIFAAVGTTTFDNVTITDSTFDGNLQKGLYFERLNNALFDNLTITNSGTDPGYAFNNGIDLNLKFDDYSNITIQNSTFNNSGKFTVAGPGGFDYASSLAIKARDDAPSYNTNPATLDNVLVQGNVFTNGTTAIRLGEPGKNNAGPTGVVITNNSLNDGTFGLAVDNTTLTAVNASGNWWGTTDEDDVDDLAGGLVDFTPFLNSGSDISGAAGFQGDFSVLNVTALGTQTGLTGRVQEGVDLVDADGVVNVGPGIFDGTIVIGKTVDLVGSVDLSGEAASTLTVNLPGGGNLLAIQGNGFTGSQDVNLSNFNFVGNGPNNVDNGVRVESNAVLDTVSIQNSTFTQFDTLGVAVFGNAVTGISAQNLVFNDLVFFNNGFQNIGGAGDINIFEYNGNASLTDLVLSNSGTGARQGIQFRGVGAANGVGVLPIGTVSLDNVDISGIYRTSYLGFQRYSDVTSLTLSDVELGGTTGSQLTGTFGAALRFDAVGTGTVGSPATVDLGNTHFRGFTAPNMAGAFDIEFAPDNNFAFLRADATDTIWSGTAASALTLSELFAVEDRILHYVDGAHPMHGTFNGFAEVREGNAYVTDTFGGSIQRGVEVVDAAGTVNVAAGLYVEDVNINRANLTVTGQGVSGLNETRVEGAIGGDGATFRIGATGVTLENFVITRQGNNAADWNNPGLNSAGVAIQGQAADATIQNNMIVGNRTGIDVNNSNDNIIQNNIIDNNHTGLIFRNQTDNTTLTENFITNNRTVGVLFLDASGGDNDPVQSAVNSTFFNNNISGNWYGQIVDRQAGGTLPAPGTTNLKNFSGNWLGNTDPNVTTANSAEPGYAVLIPPEFGGSAMAPPPGSQPDVAGAASANFDITPLLGSGTDTDLGTFGFQGDFSTLYVTPKGAQVGGGGRINEAIGLVTDSTVIVNDGVYNEDVLVNIDDLTLRSVNGAGTTIINGQSTGFTGAVRTASGVENFTLGGMGVGFTINGVGQAGLYLGGANDGHLIQGNIINAAAAKNALLTEGGQSNHSIEGNTFSNVSGSASQLVYVNGTASVAVASTNVDFIGNTFSGSAAGPQLGQEASGSEISGNIFTGTAGVAIGVNGDANLIDDNTLTGGGTGTGIGVQNFGGSAQTVTISGNTIQSYANGISVNGLNTLNLTDNNSIGNTSGGSLTNVGTVNLTTNDDDNTVDINGASAGMNQFAVVGQLQAINYTGLVTLNVDTLDGDDTVNVAAHPTTLIDLDGGDPMVPPGDTLNYLSDGVNAFNIGPATITTANHANINYVNFENVNVGGNLIINGSGDDDHLIINATGENSGTFQLIQNGIAGPVVGFSGVTSIVFNGLAGDDVMTINQPDNDFLNPADGIVFNGGTQVGDGNASAGTPGGDTLIINHAMPAQANAIGYVFAPPTGDGNGGTITIDDTAISDGSTTITFSGLEPVLDGMSAADRTFNYNTTGAEAITLESPGVGGLANRIGSNLTESVSFNDPSTLLTLNAGDNDSFEVLAGNVDLGAAILFIAAGSIELTGNLSTTNSAFLAATAGNITDNADDNIANLTANNLVLTVVGGNRLIGNSASNRLEINAVQLDINTTGVGNNDAFIRDTAGGLQITDSSLGAGGSVFDVQVLNGNLTSLAGGMADLRADVVIVEVTGAGQIGTSSAQPLDINANTRFDATSAGGDIFVRDATTGFPLGLVNANGGNVELTTNVGSFTDANGAANNISAATATLTALNAVGASGDSLETSVDELIVSAATGIFISEANAVTVTSATTTNGDIRITSGGTMTATNVVAGGIGRDVTLTTTAGDMVVGSVTALGDRVTLNASDSVLDGVETAAPSLVIDDGDPGYADDGMTPFGGQGFQNDVHFSGANGGGFDNPGHTATWTFSGLAPGMYTVAATWSIHPNRATNAPYTVTDANGSTEFLVNQELTPESDFIEMGTPFQQLGGTFVVDGSGTLVVSLTDIGANEFVIADAVRIQMLAGPDVVADELVVTAGGSVGTSLDSLDTQVSNLEADATAGDIYLDNTGNLTIGGITGLVGVNAGGSVIINNAGSVNVNEAVTAGDDVLINAFGSLTVAANVTAGGQIDLVAVDSATAGQNLTVNTLVTVQSMTGLVSLRAGDDLTLADSSNVIAATIISLFGDFGDADSGVGSNVTLLGTLDAMGTANSIIVDVDDDNDTILVNPGMLHTADGLTIFGSGGNDTYEIFFGRLNGGLSAVTIVGTDAGTDQATLQGTANGETFEVDGQMGGTVNNTTESEQVNYTGDLEFLTINGNQGNDTFTGSTSVGDTDPGLEPSFTTTITLDGEDPGFGDPNAPGGTPPGTGDTLILNSLGNVFQIIGTSIFVDGNGDMQVVTQNPPGPDAGDYQTINFRRIENLPLEPQGPDTLFFDFDHTPVSTVTQPGYQTVAKDQIFGMNGNTFGWDSAVGSFDNGAVMGSGFSDILRDGHSGTGSNTFTTQIANGVYLVTVKIGDATSARDDLRITNADTGQILLDDIDTAMGQYLSQSFVVEVTDGTLDLTIANLGGLPLWVLNGLEIRPGQILTIGSPDQETLEANGVEETTVQIFNVTPGALVTVTGFLDSDLDADEFADQDIEIVSMDAAPEIAGVQIAADMSGEYYFTFRHPSGRGTGFFTFEEVTLAPATLQTGLLAVDFIAPSVRRFDFGTQASPVQNPVGSDSNTDGYIGVVGTDVFEEGSGFGWDSAVGSFDRGPVDDAVQGDLRRDGNSGTGANTFRVELENGTYFVSLTIGDDDSARDDIQVSAEGLIVIGDVDTAAGNYKHFTFQVTVNDGILDLELENLGGLPLWVINGLEIRPTVADANFNPAGGTPADGTSIELITGTAIEAAGLLLTVTTDQGVLVNDASAEYDGHQVAVNMDGTFTIELQRPSSTMDVTANLTVLAVDGSVQDATSVLFTGFAGQPPRRFDFNRGTSPTASGFTGVLVSDLFNVGDDFGWLTSPSSFDHFTANKTTVELYQDGATRSSGAVNARTFRVTATAATNYDVRVYIGAKFAAVGQVQVSIEGGAFVALSTPVSADNFTTVTLTNVSDVNMDGFLDITFQGLTTSWYVNGVDVALSAAGLPPAAALTFAAEAGAGADALSSAELDAIVAAAITRLAIAGEDVSALDGVGFEIADLNSERALGLAGSRSIVIDDDGLGYGWFVDQTPFEDEEFTALSATSLVANSGEAAGRADLLSVVMHELGHILGHGDLDSTHFAGQLMTGELNLGERHLPGSDSESTSSDLSASDSGVSSGEVSIVDDAIESVFSDWQISSQLTAEDSEPEALRLVESESELVLVGSSESEDEVSLAVALELSAVREETSALDDLFAELTQTVLPGDSLWEQFEE